ncbi:winged helix-turn-helix transcriptional regulator [Bailinhaonella thermotolerans]|uniref:Transcriptional regulator n=1 Tax=Bailinhaonella thermotolerans TaxID=1070861 RepID=A0A3A4B442_9ACTN|nr:helix-turn-helix domain-containing protein [Bailinhaonella thermotolerans]RJL35330.1 transcriptional regulator [Bailinhaonella thermotolerans]
MSTDPAAPRAGPVVTVEAYENCPVTGLLRRIGDKWSPAVIRLLAVRGHGFNELDRAIEGISRRMLTRTLRGLEEAGLVARATSGPPWAGTEYSLTEAGRSLREQLLALGLWADAHRSSLVRPAGPRGPRGSA